MLTTPLGDQASGSRTDVAVHAAATEVEHCLVAPKPGMEVRKAMLLPVEPVHVDNDAEELRDARQAYCSPAELCNALRRASRRIGAGIAGTLLVFPYTGRAIASTVLPDVVVTQVPFFLLPILWGVWNLVYVRRQPRLDIAVWGAILGLLGGLGVNALLWVQGAWFGAAVLLPLFLPAGYYLLWLFVVGPLNQALKVDG